MISPIIAFFYVFNEMGFNEALIQESHIHDSMLSSVFWLNLLIGIVLTFIAIVLAPIISKFYGIDSLKLVVIVLSFNLVLSATRTVHQAIFMKSMNFKTLSIIEVASTSFAGLLAVILALNGWGYWSLVIQNIAANFVNTAILWILSDWRPSFIYSWKDIKQLFYFSNNVTIFKIINYIARNIDYILIGKFLGAQSLGYYTLAYKIMLYPIQNLSQVVSKVLFPSLVEIKENLDRFKSNFLNALKYIGVVSFPVMTLLIIMGPLFIETVFGQKWSTTGVIIQILALVGLKQSITSPLGVLFLSKGKPNIQMKLSLVTTIFTTLAIIIGLRWGVVGVATGYTFMGLLLFYPEVFITFRVADLKVRDFFSNFKSELISSVTMILIILILKIILQQVEINNWILIVMIPVLGFLVFYIVMWLIDKVFIKKVYKLLTDLI